MCSFVICHCSNKVEEKELEDLLLFSPPLYPAYFLIKEKNLGNDLPHFGYSWGDSLVGLPSTSLIALYIFTPCCQELARWSAFIVATVFVLCPESNLG